MAEDTIKLTTQSRKFDVVKSKSEVNRLKLAPGVEDTAWLRRKLEWWAEEVKQFPIIQQLYWLNQRKKSSRILSYENQRRRRRWSEEQNLREVAEKNEKEKAVYVTYHK